MSIIGKVVTYEFPINNKESKKGEGIVVDRFRNSATIDDKGNMAIFDNYLVRESDGTAMSIHPSLVTSINDKPEVAVKKLS